MNRPKPNGKSYCMGGTTEKIDSRGYRLQVNRIPLKRDPGGMAEWFKAAVLKTVSRKRDVGSNPTPSARKFSVVKFHYWLVAISLWPEGFGTFGEGYKPEAHRKSSPRKRSPGEMAELAEGARLLSECRRKLLPRVRIPLSPPIFHSTF
jgi:hypothetical protein